MSWILPALGILSFGLVLLIIWQKYIKAHQTQWLENTLKKASAQKILDNIQTDKTEGENNNDRTLLSP